jgi:hypothetical protein
MNRGIWYITASYDKQRLTRSLRTKDKQIAKKLKPLIELELLEELTGLITRRRNLQFDEIVQRYLSAEHNWTSKTKELNSYILNAHASGKPLPSQPTTKSNQHMLELGIEKQTDKEGLQDRRRYQR